MSSAPFYDVCSEHYDADYEAVEREDDAAFYADFARRRGGPVLEMGCGSGRVVLPTARAGVEVTGVDASPGMLAKLRRRLEREPAAVRRRVTLVEGDVGDLDLGRRFPLVTAPFRVIQHLLSRDEQRAWLGSVARHLEPDGELLFDVFQPDFDHMVGPPRGVVDLEREEPDGSVVHRVATAWHTPELQTFRVRFEWRRGSPPSENGEERSAAPEATPAADAGKPSPVAETLSVAETEVRWFTRAELENLLELEGFQVLDVWGDFARTPHGPGAEEVVLHARRRS